MTRGQDGNIGSGSNQPTSGSSESIPDAILTLTKNVLGQNVTKSIEPLIKRVGDGEHSSIVTDHHRRKKKRDHSTKKQSLTVSDAAVSAETTTSSSKNGTANDGLNVSSTEPSILIISSSVEPGNIFFFYIIFTNFKGIFKIAKAEDIQGKEGENRCITPQGRPGTCEDLSVCPELLLNLADLRDSLCFKRLFLPGVCCPITNNGGSTVLTTQKPTILTAK